MLTADDDYLVRLALRAAMDEQHGNPIPESAKALIRATVMTRSETRRLELEREAASRSSDLTEVGLGVLKILFRIVL